MKLRVTHSYAQVTLKALLKIVDQKIQFGASIYGN